MRFYTFFLLLLLTKSVFSQDEILPTFDDTRLINTQTTEILKPGNAQFRLAHRFGNLNSGFSELYGLDQATIRMGLDFGISKHIMIGAGRSSYEKTWDAFLKIKLLEQKNGTPFTLTWFSNTMINGLKKDPTRSEYFSSRMSFAHQLMISRRFSDRLSLQIAPILVHRNLVPTEKDPNNMGAIVFAGKYSISRVWSIITEYGLRIPEKGSVLFDPYYNSFSIGTGVNTKGHYFSFFLTNSQSIFERGFLFETNQSWIDGDIRFGFCIMRNFKIK